MEQKIEIVGESWSGGNRGIEVTVKHENASSSVGSAIGGLAIMMGLAMVAGAITKLAEVIK